MRRHVIIGQFRPDDNFHVHLGVGEHATHLELVDSQGKLDNGIGGALEDLARVSVFPNERGVDLLVVAAHVHAADTRVSRDSESQDNWTRELRLVIPVSDPTIWTDVAPIFVRLLNFLTGDRWVLQFRSRPEAFASTVPVADSTSPEPRFDHLALFSGGLDSLIGAIDALEAGLTPLLVSHAGDGPTSDAQAKLLEGLHAYYPDRPFHRLRVWMTFPEDLIEDSAPEPSTRGRSLLFFAVGVLAGIGLPGARVLHTPENGLIALNVPLDPLRLGALSTRTTHPFYIARWNEALEFLGMNVRIENPYWDKTKGEMVRDCSNHKLLAHLAPESLSCSSPSKGRWRGLGIQHCGYCLPCLIRRAALTKGLLPQADSTVYTIDDLTARPLSTRESEGIQVRSFHLAIDRIRARPQLAPLLIHKPGPLVDESAARQAALAELYRRGLEEVGALLADVKTEST
jgi:hypothetical protein